MYRSITTISDIESQKVILKRELEKTTIELAKQPVGELILGRKGKHCNFYVREGNVKTYLSKKNPKKISQMVKKRFLQSLKDDIELELHALDAYEAAKRHCPGKVASFINNDEIIQYFGYSHYNVEEFVNLESWAKTAYDMNTAHSESLVHKTLSGQTVRSKSEVMICDLLTSNHIPFHYEERLTLGSISLFPDFKILRPRDKKVIYWEHFGLFDNQKYREDALRKVNLYSDHGIFPGDSLILTYETSKMPLTQLTIQNTIEMFLM